ncbi:MAG: ATP-binding protein [bacterium]
MIEADEEEKFEEDTLQYLQELKENNPAHYETEIFKKKLSRISKRIDYCNNENQADITVKLATFIYHDINNKKTIKFVHLALAIGELLLNAIVYGNQLDLAKPVFFSWEVTQEQLIISVGDYGIQELSFTENDVKSISESHYSRDFWEKIEFADDEKLSGSGLGIPAILKVCGFTLTSTLLKNENQKPLGKLIKAVKSLK